MVHDLRVLYDNVIRNGAHASGTDFAVQERLPGRTPRPFEASLGELATGWS